MWIQILGFYFLSFTEDLPDEFMPPNPDIIVKGLFLVIDKILLLKCLLYGNIY